MAFKTPDVTEESTASLEKLGASEDSASVLQDASISNIHFDPLKSVIYERSYDDNLRPEDEKVVHDHLDDHTIEEALEIIKQAVIDHQDDTSVPSGKLEYLESLLAGPNDRIKDEWEHELKFQAFLIYDWSIYPEVRSATVPIDEEEQHDPETYRAYFLGLIFGMSGTCLNTFFFNRFPNITISAAALQVFVAIIGRVLARIPVQSIPLGFNKRLTINPGPWSFKEQMLTQLIMSISVGSPYAYYAIVSQKNQFFYGFDNVSFGYVAMLVFSSQFMGFGISGLLRAFLIYPQQCVWYTILPNIVYVRSLAQQETRENIHGWKLLRWELFAISAVMMFVWFWITNFVFQALSYFDWPAWIAPNNVRLQNMTGMLNGLGVNPWSTFDFNNANFGGMISPFWATGTQYVGIIISLFAILIVWFTNVNYSAYMPVNTNTLFDNTGNPYDVTQVLNANGQLDKTKYESYSLPFYTAGNLIQYGTFFMIYPAMIVYSILNYSKQLSLAGRLLIANFRNPRAAIEFHNDRFSRVQRKYKEVPELYFLFILIASIALAIAMVEYYSFTNTPVWTIFFAVGLASLFSIPFGILYSISNIQIDVNVLTELIIGYALPGNGNALMISKVFATNFMSQADNFITNQKSAHYTGIAPRALFRAQMISVLCNSWVQIGLIWWQINDGVPDMCDPHNRQKFTCADARTFFNASVIWGTIGPKRVFTKLYPSIKYCFLIGALYPLPFWVCRKYIGPYIQRRTSMANVTATHTMWGFVSRISKLCSAFFGNEILVLSGGTNWAPYNLSYMTPNLYLGLFFNWFLRHKYHAWWRKYNYILNNGWSVGIAYGGLILFFATQYHHVVSINWWGNNVPFVNGDATGLPLLDIPDVGYFGPVPGTYP